MCTGPQLLTPTLKGDMPISLQGSFIPWEQCSFSLLASCKTRYRPELSLLKGPKKKTLLRPPELDMKSHSVEIIQTATPKVKETISYLCKYEHFINILNLSKDKT